MSVGGREPAVARRFRHLVGSYFEGKANSRGREGIRGTPGGELRERTWERVKEGRGGLEVCEERKRRIWGCRVEQEDLRGRAVKLEGFGGRGMGKDLMTRGGGGGEGFGGVRCGEVRAHTPEVRAALKLADFG